MDARRGDSLELNPELTQIKIVLHDDEGRDHLLVADFHCSKFPLVSPIWMFDLPFDFHPLWRSDVSLRGMPGGTLN